MWKVWLLLTAVVLGGLGTAPGGYPETPATSIPLEQEGALSCCSGPPPGCPPLCNCPPHCNSSN